MSIPLGKLVNVNPLTPEFLNDRDAEVSFMPLAAVWPYGRADVSGRAIAAKVAGGYTLFRNGDVLVPKITPTFEAARAIVADLQTPLGAGTTELHVLRTLPGVDARFIAYVARSLPFLQEGATTLQGVGNLRRVPTDWLTKFPILVTDLEEQQVIADYLDRETQRIDELIAVQRGLIETLRERKRSVVDRGAGKAGVGRTRLRHLFSSSDARGYPNEQILSVYREYGVIPKGSRDGNHNVTPEDVSRYLLVRPGDLVVNRMKAWQGSLGMSDHRGIVSGDYEVLRPTGNRLLPRFSHLYLRSARMVGEYAVRSTGIRPSQWRLYWKQMADIEIPVPSIQKQQEIVTFVEDQTSGIDVLISESEDLISLSQERRAALITAAVSGQIDVRTAV